MVDKYLPFFTLTSKWTAGKTLLKTGAEQQDPGDLALDASQSDGFFHVNII
jgi:hypothetical protein